MKKKLILSLLAVVSIIHGGNGAILKFITAGASTLRFIEKFSVLKTFHGDISAIWQDLAGKTASNTEQILEDLKELRNEVKQLQARVTSKLDDIYKILKNQDDADTIKNMRLKMANHIQIVDEAYQIFTTYIDGWKNVNNIMLEKFVNEDCKNVDDSLSETRRSVAPAENVQYLSSSFPVLYAKVSTNLNDEICGAGINHQQYLLQVFTDMMATETKAMMMLTFCRKLEHPEESAWPVAHEVLKREFKDRHNSYVREFSKGIAQALRTHRSCDPSDGWTRGTSYVELEGFKRATFFSWGRWAGGCSPHADYINGESTHQICDDDDRLNKDCYLQEKEVCSGTLFECRMLNEMQYCPLINDDPRRFSWIKGDKSDEDYKNKYGRTQDGCSLYPIHSQWQYCLCKCEQPTASIALQITSSATSENSVITAVRFAFLNKLLFVQIKEGILGPNGTVTESSDAWAPTFVSSMSGTSLVFKGDTGFNFDSLQGNDDEVLTGVGFTRVSGYEKPRIGLTLKVTKFDYETGLLKTDRTIHPSSIRHNDAFEFENENSIYSDGPQKPSVTAGKYITFKSSSFTGDAGQATLPQFEAVPAQMDPPFLLSGILFTHKGTPNHAGFLTLQVIALNISRYFDEKISLLS